MLAVACVVLLAPVVVHAEVTTTLTPAHTATLTPKNFHSWVQDAIEQDKTAFVRFIDMDDEEHRMAAVHQSSAWNDITLKMGHPDAEVSFGDHIVSEYDDPVELDLEHQTVDVETVHQDGGCTIRHFNRSASPLIPSGH
jgi:hypothetical protein